MVRRVHAPPRSGACLLPDASGGCRPRDRRARPLAGRRLACSSAPPSRCRSPPWIPRELAPGPRRPARSPSPTAVGARADRRPRRRPRRRLTHAPPPRAPPPRRPRRPRRRPTAARRSPTPTPSPTWPAMGWPTSATTLGTIARRSTAAAGATAWASTSTARRAGRSPARPRSRSSPRTTRARAGDRQPDPERPGPRPRAASRASSPPPLVIHGRATDVEDRRRREDVPGRRRPEAVPRRRRPSTASRRPTWRIRVYRRRRHARSPQRGRLGQRRRPADLDAGPVSSSTPGRRATTRIAGCSRSAGRRAPRPSSTTSRWTCTSGASCRSRCRPPGRPRRSRAQADAARCYAVRRLHPGDGSFDVYDDTRSQVYRGRRGASGAPPTRSSAATRAGDRGHGDARQRLLPLDRRRLDREQRVRVRGLERRRRVPTVAYLRGIADRRPDGRAVGRRLAALVVVDEQPHPRPAEQRCSRATRGRPSAT